MLDNLDELLMKEVEDMRHILLVEDDPKLLATLNALLEMESYKVQMAADGTTAAELVRSQDFDLLILDWELPGISGLDLCKQFRARGVRTPIIFVTARTGLESLDLAFVAGADDYLRKPFHVRELVLRMEACLRKEERNSGFMLKYGPFVMDTQTLTFFRDGQEILLTKQEFSLMEELLRQPERLFTPEEILEVVWRKYEDTTENALRTAIMKLRRKIDLPDRDSFIRTVHGLGYKLVV
ncbi:MAG: response regulator transcription factor [Candidatus Obscuribacterales bacterium]|nr:response regulator transcription factor [Candidatus Obscuribacterales bacterium]